MIYFMVKEQCFFHDGTSKKGEWVNGKFKEEKN